VHRQERTLFIVAGAHPHQFQGGLGGALGPGGQILRWSASEATKVPNSARGGGSAPENINTWANARAQNTALVLGKISVDLAFPASSPRDSTMAVSFSLRKKRSHKRHWVKGFVPYQSIDISLYIIKLNYRNEVMLSNIPLQIERVRHI
jgi:hypothetical protein